MKRMTILVSAIVVTVLAMGAVAAEKPAKDGPAAEPSAELKVLYKFVGNWRGTTTIHKAKWTPKEISGTSTTSCVRVLGGRFTMNKTTTSDGETALTLTTYDARKKCYRMWWFNSRGDIVESEGKWDGPSKTSTWRNIARNNGVTSVATARYLDDNTVKWTVVTKDRSGEIGFSMVGNETRVKQLPKLKAPPADKPAERSTEQKVLDRFIGTWRSKQEVMQAPEMEQKKKKKKKKRTTELIYTRILGGKFVQERGKGTGADKTETLTMFTYDTQPKSYRLWWFSSTGQTLEAAGKWDAETKTITWRRVDNDAPKFTMTARHRFANDNAIEWDVETKDGKGKVTFRLDGKATRASQPTKKKGD